MAKRKYSKELVTSKAGRKIVPESEVPEEFKDSEEEKIVIQEAENSLKNDVLKAGLELLDDASTKILDRTKKYIESEVPEEEQTGMNNAKIIDDTFTHTLCDGLTVSNIELFPNIAKAERVQGVFASISDITDPHNHFKQMFLTSNDGLNMPEDVKRKMIEGDWEFEINGDLVPAQPKDIVFDKVVYMKRDDGNYRVLRITSILNPKDSVNAFTGHDGNTYGLDNCFIVPRGKSNE